MTNPGKMYIFGKLFLQRDNILTSRFFFNYLVLVAKLFLNPVAVATAMFTGHRKLADLFTSTSVLGSQYQESNACTKV